MASCNATYRLFLDDVLVGSQQFSAQSVGWDEGAEPTTLNEVATFGNENTIKVELHVEIVNSWSTCAIQLYDWDVGKAIFVSGKLAHYGIGAIRYTHSGTTITGDRDSEYYPAVPYNGTKEEVYMGPGGDSQSDHTFGPTAGRYEQDPYRFVPVKIEDRENIFVRSGNTSVEWEEDPDDQWIYTGYTAAAGESLPEPYVMDAFSYNGTIDILAYRYERFTYWYNPGYKYDWPSPGAVKWFRRSEYGNNPLQSRCYDNPRTIGWVLDAPELTRDQLFYVHPSDIPDSVYSTSGTYLGHRIFAPGRTVSASDSAGGGGLFDFWPLYTRPTYLPTRSRRNPHDIVRASQAYGNKVIIDG